MIETETTMMPPPRSRPAEARVVVVAASPRLAAVPAKRVCMVAYSEVVADPRILQEATALSEAGWEVDVIGVRPRAFPWRAPAGIRVHFVPMVVHRGSKWRYLYQYGLFFLQSTARLFALHLRRRFDAVHVHSVPDFQVACALPLRLLGVRIVLDLHESMPELLAARFRLRGDSLWVRAAVAVEKVSCRLADRVVASNPAIGQLAISRGAPAERVEVVYNIGPADPRADPEFTRRKFALRGSPLIVHVGGINPERDLETLIRAAAIVSRASPVRVVVAGSGDEGYVASLQRMARDLGIADLVDFIGQVPMEEAQSLMALSSVGVVTLETNPLTAVALPNRVLGFARLSKPLVLPDLPLLRRLFDGGAYFYAPGDPEDLAARVREAWSNNGETHARVVRANGIAKSISGPAMARRLAALYAGLGA